MGHGESKIRTVRKPFTLPEQRISSAIVSSGESTIPVSPSQEIIEPDGVTIFWLDARVNSNSDDMPTTRFMLNNIHSSVFFFDDVHRCEDALRSNTNTKSHVFLIVSGKYAMDVLSIFKQLPVIDSIFIYCARPERYQHLVVEHSPRVVGVFSSQDELRVSLERELDQYHIREPVLNFFTQKQTNIRDVTRDAASFL